MRNLSLLPHAYDQYSAWRGKVKITHNPAKIKRKTNIDAFNKNTSEITFWPSITLWINEPPASQVIFF